MSRRESDPVAPSPAGEEVLRGLKIYLSVRDFTGDERLKHVAKKLIKKLGARLTLSLQDADVVVFSNGSDALFQNATAIGKPVVRVEWLAECKTAKSRLSFAPFHVLGNVISKSGLLQPVSILSKVKNASSSPISAAAPQAAGPMSVKRPYLMDDDDVMPPPPAHRADSLLEPIATQQLSDNLDAILRGAGKCVELATVTKETKPTLPALKAQAKAVTSQTSSSSSSCSSSASTSSSSSSRSSTSQPVRRRRRLRGGNNKSSEKPNRIDTMTSPGGHREEVPLTFTMDNLRPALQSRRGVPPASSASRLVDVPKVVDDATSVTQAIARPTAPLAASNAMDVGKNKKRQRVETRRKSETAEQVTTEPVVIQPATTSTTPPRQKRTRPRKAAEAPIGNLLNPQPARIAMSGQDRDQKSVLRSIVENMNVEVPTVLFGRVKKPTHLVVVGSDICLPVLLSKALRIPILSPSWVYDSLSAGGFVVPTDEHIHPVFGHYPPIIDDNSNDKAGESPAQRANADALAEPKSNEKVHRKWTEATRLEQHRLEVSGPVDKSRLDNTHVLRGMTFVLLGQGESLTNTHAQELVSLLGGSIHRYLIGSSGKGLAPGEVDAIIEMDGGLEYNRIMFPDAQVEAAVADGPPAASRPKPSRPTRLGTAAKERASLENLLAACDHKIVITKWLVDCALSSSRVPVAPPYVANPYCPAIAQHRVPATPKRVTLTAAAKPSCGPVSAIKQPSRQLNTQQLQNSQQAPDDAPDDEDDDDGGSVISDA